MNNRYEVFRHKRRWFVIDNRTGAKTMCRTIHDARELCDTFVSRGTTSLDQEHAAMSNYNEGSLLRAIQDALGTAESGDALVEVARNARRAEQQLAHLCDRLNTFFDEQVDAETALRYRGLLDE